MSNEINPEVIVTIEDIEREFKEFSFYADTLELKLIDFFVSEKDTLITLLNKLNRMYGFFEAQDIKNNNFNNNFVKNTLLRLKKERVETYIYALFNDAVAIAAIRFLRSQA